MIFVLTRSYIQRGSREASEEVWSLSTIVTHESPRDKSDQVIKQTEFLEKLFTSGRSC